LDVDDDDGKKRMLWGSHTDYDDRNYVADLKRMLMILLMSRNGDSAV
jgi:hypothetical protein